jgi:hypothetical protein
MELEHSEDIAQAVVPKTDDSYQSEKKHRYLSFRVAGFSIKEACELARVTLSGVRHWRNTDEEFANLDGSGLSEIKKQLSAEYLNIEFTRNFRLALLKDYNVLLKSIKAPDSLSIQETRYLEKARQFYTPQHWALLQQLIGESSGDEFSWNKLVLEIRREREEVIIRNE